MKGFILTALLLTTLPTLARDNGQWDAIPSDIRRWYQNLMQPDQPTNSCCGESDAYWADSYEVSKDGEYIAIITDTRTIPSRRDRKVGTKVLIPNHKIKWNEGNPTGHGVVFMGASNDIVFCYVPPGGV